MDQLIFNMDDILVQDKVFVAEMEWQDHCVLWDSFSEDLSNNAA